MENSKAVLQDIENFKMCVQNLSSAVNSAGVDWRDSKYQNLVSAVQSIATSTKSLVEAGEDCAKDIKVFESYIDE